MIFCKISNDIHFIHIQNFPLNKHQIYDENIPELSSQKIKHTNGSTNHSALKAVYI